MPTALESRGSIGQDLLEIRPELNSESFESIFDCPKKSIHRKT